MMNEAIKIQYNLLLDRYDKITWTHKIQEKQGDIYINKANNLKTKMAVWSVLTTTSAVATAIEQLVQSIGCEWIGSLLTALFAGISAFYVFRYKDESYESKAKENKAYAAKCRRIRNLYESLLTDIKSEFLSSMDEVISSRNTIEQEENLLFSGEVAPHTSAEAREEAKKALKIDKESISEQDELDAIIPSNLRLD